MEGLYHAAERAGVHIVYQARARELYREAGAVRGVQFEVEGTEQLLRASAVVLACGGFESNAAWRAQYLGPGWDLAKVRGTRYNVGDGLEMALAVGADPAGHWSGCHAVAWDRNAPDYGDLTVGDAFQKHSYPLGIIVNIRGERFVDEGADFRNYTYAKYGQEILRQPEQVAWQVFDQKVIGMLRDEYRIRQVSKVRADTLEHLAQQMDGIDEGRFLGTVRDFNCAVRTAVNFDPNSRDGRATEGIQPRKSNWANTLDTPPYEAYQVTCGITFTFGGLRITPEASVVGSNGAPIAGLFAAGEIVGGLFYFNYPGGTGLTSGAVFGRIAGMNAGASNPL